MGIVTWNRTALRRRQLVLWARGWSVGIGKVHSQLSSISRNELTLGGAVPPGQQGPIGQSVKIQKIKTCGQYKLLSLRTTWYLDCFSCPLPSTEEGYAHPAVWRAKGNQHREFEPADNGSSLQPTLQLQRGLVHCTTDAWYRDALFLREGFSALLEPREPFI